MIEEKNKKLIEQSQKNITEKDIKQKEEIKEVKQKDVEIILKGLDGIALKFGDCIFRVNYTNPGKCRFSAECINVKES